MYNVDPDLNSGANLLLFRGLIVCDRQEQFNRSVLNNNLGFVRSIMNLNIKGLDINKPLEFFDAEGNFTHSLSPIAYAESKGYVELAQLLREKTQALSEDCAAESPPEEDSSRKKRALSEDCVAESPSQEGSAPKRRQLN